jgi:hypothetical protein
MCGSDPSDRSMTDCESVRAGAPWTWAGLSLAGLVLAFLAAFGIAITLLSRGLMPDAATGLRVDLALFLLLWGSFSIVGVLVAARLAFSRWLEWQARSLGLPALGIALAIAEELALHEWAEASIGFYDWDFIGWTAALSFCLVGLAVALFGISIAPRASGRPPAIAMKLAAALVLFVVLWNVPALLDGIGPHSWPIATLVGASGLYAAAAVLIDRFRARC